MKKLRRIFLCMMLSCWVAAGILPFFRPLMTPPVSHCEENPCKNSRGND